MLSSFRQPTTNVPYILSLATVTLAAGAFVYRWANRPYSLRYRDSARCIPSPRETLLPHISDEEAKQLAYPPNVMPGERDVKTPYGTMRVNEWGPEDGKRILFVHGDATPSPIWFKVAQGLAEHGCRVLTFDLWGRGYSDTPLKCRHDSRFFATQVMLAIGSSPIMWTAGEGFSIVGFSFGGGVSVEFASIYPHFVNSVVLMAPGGMLRQVPSGYDSIFIQYPWLIPQRRYLRTLISSMIGVELNNPKLLKHKAQSSSPEAKLASSTQLSEQDTSCQRSELAVADLVQWQFDFHHGLVDAIANSSRYGPIQYHHSSWRKMCDIISGRVEASSKLRGSQLLVVLGDSDVVVDPLQTKEDILKLISAKDVRFVNLPDGHGFLHPHSNEIVGILARHWRLVD